VSTDGFKLFIQEFWDILATIEANKGKKDFAILLGEDKFNSRFICREDLKSFGKELEDASRIAIRHPISTYYQDTKTKKVVPILATDPGVSNASAASYLLAGQRLSDLCLKQDSIMEIKIGDKTPPNYNLSLDDFASGENLFDSRSGRLLR